MANAKELIERRDRIKSEIRTLKAEVDRLQDQIDAQLKKEAGETLANERDKFVVANTVCRYPGNDYDIFAFSNMSAETLEHCVKKGWADPEDAQNNSPSIKEMLVFLHDNPSFRAHGYVVSPKREDTRISIEGVESANPPSNEVKEFVEIFRHADEFEWSEERCYAWFD